MCYKNTFVHLIIIINITVIQTVIYTYSNFLLFEKVGKLKWDTSKSKRPLKSQTRLTRPLSNIFHSMFEFGRFLKPDWRVGRIGECLVQIPFLSQMLTIVYVSCLFLPQMIFAFLLFCCLQCVFTCYWSEMFSITLSCWANTVFLYWGLVDPIRSKFLHAFRKPDQTCSKSLQFLKSRN